MREGIRRGLFILVLIIISVLVFENSLVQAEDPPGPGPGCRIVRVGDEIPEMFPPPSGYGAPGGSWDQKNLKDPEEEDPPGEGEGEEEDPKGKEDEKVDPENSVENATTGGQRSKRSSLSAGEYQFMRSIELNDEGAMEFNTIQVPPSGALKDNFEVSYSNGQVMFTLPIGINLKGRKGHDIELKLQFNSGIDRPDGKFGNFWNFIPNGFIYFDQLIELGEYQPGEAPPPNHVYMCDMVNKIPYLYQFQDGRLSVITNVDALKEEGYFENANADYVYPDETLSAEAGYQTNSLGYLVLSAPNTQHSWIAPSDMVCDGFFKPFANNHPNEHIYDYMKSSFIFSPGSSKVLRGTQNGGFKVREKNGTIYTYSPFYKRQDKRYDILAKDMCHQNLPSNPTKDHQYSRSQCRSRLKAIRYPDGDKITYNYDEWDRIESIKDSLGRHIYFTYNSNNPNRIESISDFEGYPSFCKRTALFTYYDETSPNAGLLKEVITPWPTQGLKGGDSFDGIAWKFDYECVKEDNPKSYKAALAERTYLERFKAWSPSEDMVNDQPYFHAEFYEDWADYPSSVFHREYRVKHLTCGRDISGDYKAGGTYTYSYTKQAAARITTCELPDLPEAPSQTNAYVFDSKSNLLSEIIDYYGTPLETHHQYRPDTDDPNEFCYPFGLVYKTVYPKGNKVINNYQYDKYLTDLIPFVQRDNFQVGNLLKTEYLSSDNVVMSCYEYTYEPYFNRLYTETDYNGNTRTNYYGFQELDKSIADLVLPTQWGVDDSDFIAGNNFSLGDLNDTNGGVVGDETHIELVRVEEPVVTRGLAGQGSAQIAYTTFKYNDALQLIEECDAEGRVTRYEYYSDLADPDGDGEYLIDPEDQAKNGSGYLKKVISAPGTILETFTEYKYNSVGDLLSEIDSYGNRTIYSVNERHQVWKERRGEIDQYGVPLYGDSAWSESLFYYDIEGNAVEVRDRNDNTETSAHQDLLNPGYVTSLYEYDIIGQLRKSSRECVYIDHDDGDAKKHKMLSEHFVYDARNQLTHYISPGGSVVKAKYDNVRNKISEKRKLTESETMPWDGVVANLPGNSTDDDVLSFTYDLNGNLETMTDAENDTFTIEYDGMDRRTKLIKPTGSTLEHVLDEVGNITSIIERGVFSPDQTEIIVELKKKELSYDERNRLYYEKTHYYEIDETGEKNDVTTGTHSGYTEVQYKLNRVGEIVLTKDDNENESETDYDLLGQVENEYSPAIPGFTGKNYTHYIYDKVGNVLETISHEFGFKPGPSEPVEEEITYRTINEYDGLYRLTKTTKDSDGGTDQEWIYAYDQLGNKITETNPKGVGTKYYYDTFGRMTTQIFGYNSGFTSGVIADGGDNSDQLITKKMGYDDNGNLLYEKDDLGNPTRYEYDSLNRKTAIKYADGTSESIHYRKDSLLEDLFTYDDGDNLIFKIHSDYTQKRKTTDTITIEPGSGLYGNTNISYQYDGLDRIVDVTTYSNNDPNPYIYTNVERRYDSLDNVVEETQSITGTGISEQETVYLEYNGLKSRTKISTTLPTYSVSYTFDELQRISAINGMTSLGIGQTSRKYQGPGGRITSINNINSTQTLIHTDGYDVFGRLTDLTHQNAAMFCDFTYEYDIGNCRTFELKGHHINKDNGYQYDLANRLVRYDQGHYNSQNHALEAPFGDPRTFGLDGVGNFKTHNGNSNLANSLNAYDSFDGTSLDYDARGNTTDIGTLDLKYDVFGRVVGAFSGSISFVTYVYDGFGRRLMKIVDDDMTFYLMEGDRVLQEYGDTTTKSYVWGAGIDELVGLKVGSSSYHAHLDALGSVAALSNSNGDLVERYDYDPYGVCTIGDVELDGFVGNPYQFTGRRDDSEIGLYYYRARHYSPIMGRFLSRDPIGTWGDVGNYGNTYGYAGNNPLIMNDAMGKKAYFISGFTNYTYRGVNDTGICSLIAADPDIRSNVGNTNIPVEDTNFSHIEVSDIICDIVDTINNNPDTPIVLIGHSLGGGSAAPFIASALSEGYGINVDMIISIDGVGNSKRANSTDEHHLIYSSSGDGIFAWFAATGISGSKPGDEKIGVDKTTHSKIDDNPRVKKEVKRLTNKLKNKKTTANSGAANAKKRKKKDKERKEREKRRKRAEEKVRELEGSGQKIV